MLRRLTGAILSAALVLAAVGACSGPKDDGTSTARDLAAAIGAHTVGQVHFDKPAEQVQKELSALAHRIDPVWPKVSVDTVAPVDDNTARATLHYTWTLPKVAKPWTYTAGTDLVRTGDGWTVKWTPALVEPSLKPGEELALSSVEAPRADILDATGQPIVKERPVQTVGLDKKALDDAQAATSAKALAAVVDIDPAAYAAKVAGYGPEAFVEAITLRQDAFDALDQGRLRGIKGFLAVAGERPLAPTRTFAAALLGSVREATAEDIKKSNGTVTAGQSVGASGLQDAFNRQLAGTPGVTISAVPGPDAASGSATNTATANDPASTPSASTVEGTSTDSAAQGVPRPLFTSDPVPGKPVKTTLVPKLQSAAESTLADVKTPSAIVAIRPSTGAILAAANGPDSNGYNTAFLGRYAPGSTFKIATSLGLFRHGMTPNSTVDCSESFIADGKKFQNAQGYAPEALGPISLTTAIAHSCNTAFVSEYQKLSQPELADAAGALGLGMTNDLGLEAFTGNVPRDDSGTAHAASMIGQGRVQASPLAMATLMATVAHGSLVVPSLVDGHDGGAKPAHGAPLTTAEAGQLRTMMRAVVTDGYLTTLVDLPGPAVIGKTGTAEFGTDNPPRTHSWVIAAQGDLAVAVFVEDGDLGAVTGGPLMKKVLQAAAAQ